MFSGNTGWYANEAVKGQEKERNLDDLEKLKQEAPRDLKFQFWTIEE